MLIMLPILTIYADFFGMVGGYLIGVGKLNISHSMYMQTTINALAVKDVMTGLVKSVFFAVIICTIACFEGMNSGGGAEGVGKATTSSVVKSFMLIIIADCFFTALFYFIKWG
jgi:phospholipid/cholesterol/gamma-HCH transport system permease protein